MSTSGGQNDQTKATVPAHGTGPDNPPLRELGSVKLIEIIGRGASGVVYRGYDRVLGRAVAVKFLEPLECSVSASQQRFLDEARAAAAVHHPNLVEIYQAGMADKTPYLILQYIEGQTLSQLLQRRGPLPVPLVAAIIDETAAAVGELHGHGIIHRDLKPSNILLDSDGHVHVSDLGVSLRRLGGADAHVGIAGTPPFMAPELFEGRPSFRSDIYALGVTLFELLTGKAPFDGNLEELRNKHLHEPFPVGLLVDRNVPAPLIDVIERAMHKQPAFRYKSPQDLARAFIVAIGRPPDLGKARIELTLLLALKSDGAGQGDELQGSFVEGAISSTIARIADEKRQRRLAMEPTPPLPLPPLPQRTSSLDFHVPCIGCGYDLCGLPKDANCPECGGAISVSLDPTRTIFAETSWLRGVVWGHSLAILSIGLCVLCLAGCLAGLVLAEAYRFRVPVWVRSLEVTRAGSGQLYYTELTDGALGMVSLIWLSPLFVGIWLMTRPRTTGAVPWGRLCRSAVAVLAGVAVFLTITSLSGWSLGGRVDHWPPSSTATTEAGAPVTVNSDAKSNNAGRPFGGAMHKARPPGLSEALVTAEIAIPIAVLVCIGAIAQSGPEQQRQRRTRRAALIVVTAAAVVGASSQFHRMRWTGSSIRFFPFIEDLFQLTATIGYALYVWTLFQSRKSIRGLIAQRAAMRPMISADGSTSDASTVVRPMRGQNTSEPLGVGLPCIRCSYDLRGISPDGRCPECGALVAASLDPSRTMFADRKWLYGVVTGLGLVFVSLGLCLLALLINALAGSPHMVWLGSAMLHTAHSFNLYYVELNDAAFGVESIVCLAPFVAGVWLITQPRAHWRSVVRSVCRCAAVVILALAGLVAAAGLMRFSAGGWIIVRGYNFDPQAPRRFGLGPILAMFEVALAVLLLWYFGSLARSVPEPPIDRRIRRSAMGFLAATVVLMALCNPDASPWGPNGMVYARLSLFARGIILWKLPLLGLITTFAGWGLFLASILRLSVMFLALAGLRGPARNL